MHARGCCAVPGRGSFVSGRGGTCAKGAAKWGTPALILLLLPKCPMCVAAYVAMFTGIGLSIEAATWLRGSTLAVCLLMLTVLVTRILRGHLLQRLLREVPPAVYPGVVSRCHRERSRRMFGLLAQPQSHTADPSTSR
jgi:hypothetical protein